MILVQSLLQRLNGSKILIAFFMLFSLTALAQPGEVDVEFSKGKEYWVHVVKEGNTLYAIKTAYKTDIPTILAHNPGMNQNLQIGQRILIPTGRTELQAKQSKAANYAVSKGETIYGISKKLKCTQAELIELNPGIEKGLKVGQEIKVPQGKPELIQDKLPEVFEPEKPEVNIEWNDSIIDHKVLKHETLYAISKRYMVPINDIKKMNGIKRNSIKVGSVIKIPLKKIEKYEVVQKEILTEDTLKVEIDSSLQLNYGYKDQYHVVIAMPFCLNKNASVMKKNSLSGKTDMYNYTKISLDFYMGAMVAIDSLKKKGLNVIVDVIDTKKDSATVAQFINSEKFTNADMIFGPMVAKNISLVSNAIKNNNQARLILPFTPNTKYIQNNPQVYLPVSSEATIVKNLAKSILEKHSKHNVILLTNGSEKEKYLLELFKESYNESSIDFPGARVIVEASIGGSSGRDFASKIIRKDTNIIISLSSDRTNASKVMTTLNKVKNKSGGYDDAYIEVYGMSSWEKYKEIKIPYKLKLNLHIPVSYHLDYDSKKYNDLVKSYRSKFNTDPNRDAVHSFDVAYHFMSNYFLQLYHHSVMNKFSMTQIGEEHGFENDNLFIVRYQNYQKVLVKQSLGH